VGDSGVGPHEADRDASSTQGAGPAVDEDTLRAQWDDDGGFEPDVPRSTRAPGAEPQVVAEREQRDDERLRWIEAEAARAARVKAEAERVRFE
jgi:hypothetical protein